jgi:hypothetical protein
LGRRRACQRALKRIQINLLAETLLRSLPQGPELRLGMLRLIHEADRRWGFVPRAAIEQDQTKTEVHEARGECFSLGTPKLFIGRMRADSKSSVARELVCKAQRVIPFTCQLAQIPCLARILTRFSQMTFSASRQNVFSNTHNSVKSASCLRFQGKVNWLAALFALHRPVNGLHLIELKEDTNLFF